MKEFDKNNINKIHIHLSYSYFVFFIFLILGILLNYLIPIDLFMSMSNTFLLGVFFVLFSSLLIIWSQRSSKTMHTKKDIHKNSFYAGPYCYTKTPTHLGLFFLMVGFGLVLDSFFVITFSIIAFLVSKYTFLRKYDELLEEKHGQNYREYKKNVRF